MNLRDFFASVVRTVIPSVIGYLLALLAGVGVSVDPTALEMIITSLFVGGYHALVRLLEAKWPVFGVLLGWMAQPQYVSLDK